MIKQKRNRRKNLLPIPEWMEIGGLVRYYWNGWRTGHLKEIKGNLVAITPLGYNSDNKKHKAKVFPLADVQKAE